MLIKCIWHIRITTVLTSYLLQMLKILIQDLIWTPREVGLCWTAKTQSYIRVTECRVFSLTNTLWQNTTGREQTKALFRPSWRSDLGNKSYLPADRPHRYHCECGHIGFVYPGITNLSMGGCCNDVGVNNYGTLILSLWILYCNCVLHCECRFHCQVCLESHFNSINVALICRSPISCVLSENQSMPKKNSFGWTRPLISVSNG